MSESIKKLIKIPSKIAVFLLRAYKVCLSPLMPPLCRYNPTCSEYMLIAIEKHGLLKGFLMGCMRIFRCAPWGGSGFDPVPDKFRLLTQKAKNTDIR